MNAISGPAGLVSNSHDRSGGSAIDKQGAVTHTLRRTGRKAVRFDGWQLIDAVGSSGDQQVWHDLNIYRTVKDTIVVELIARRALADHQDVCQVRTFEDLAAAAAWLESYATAADVPIPAGLASQDVALPWAVLQAVQMRQCIDRLQSNYQALLSEVFAALDLTDAPEMHSAASRTTACQSAA
jgi:hypothetical protein